MKELMLDLMCELDEAEVNDRAQQLSSAIVRFDEVEIEKKNQAKYYGDQLAALGGAVRRLSAVIRQRAESRPVVCAVMFHKPCQGTKRIVRKDTGEIVRDEPMSAYEHQNNLFEDKDEELEAPVEEKVEEQAVLIADSVAREDELYDDAVRLVFEFGKASTSLLQRRLRIGYGRASHLIDMMCNAGLVGPADGSKPREILKSSVEVVAQFRPEPEMAEEES
jgi:hypothetical protein